MNTLCKDLQISWNIKMKTVPRGYDLISFDVIFWFTNVSLDAMINIVLKPIYNNRGINATTIMKELMKLWAKDVHFNYNGTTYVQK